MQRSIKIIAIVVTLVFMLCALAACGNTLDGVYKSGIYSFTFDKEGTATVNAFGIRAEGKYKINDGTLSLTYTAGSLSYTKEMTFEKDGDDIIIDGTKFVKQ